jgi:hypothetical protein
LEKQRNEQIKKTISRVVFLFLFPYIFFAIPFFWSMRLRRETRSGFAGELKESMN